MRDSRRTTEGHPDAPITGFAEPIVRVALGHSIFSSLRMEMVSGRGFPSPRTLQRLISPRLASYLLPGNELLLSVLPVTLADGTESHWLQYDTCFKVQIRGGMKSYCFRCKQCHRIFYTPMGSWYLLRDDLPPRAVFGTTSGAICVRQPIAEKLQEQRWPKLSIKPIEVKDSPIDGLSKDIETLTPDMERRIAGSRF